MGVPERVAHVYYSHGLLCSSHPVIILATALSVILLSCYPLLYVPMPGDVPVQLITPGDNMSLPENRTAFLGDPAIYVQQIVLRTGVSPWVLDLKVQDAFRSPLRKVFPLLETIRNFQLEDNSVALDNVCLHVESVKVAVIQERRRLLPEYSCLVLSPANFWQQDDQTFQTDSNLLGTIFGLHSYQKGKISLAEIFLGINMKETGLKRYPLRARTRTIQFAVTLVLKSYNPKYLAGLRKKLESQYPLHAGSNGCEKIGNSSKGRSCSDAVHIYYPAERNMYELVPLFLVYCALFLYLYFSFRKIEPVKSKAGMALFACMTILCCLLMSMGLCFFFGVTESVSGKEMFPYLVVLVGLENILVITKSITNTPAHLDVKIRVAQGLSREGWSITKNLLLQVTILTLGLATFISTVQELCILGLVGLICDYFLQLVFYTTILSIDMHRAELSDPSRHNYYAGNPLHKLHQRPDYRFNVNGDPMKMHRSKSHHNLTTHSLGGVTSGPTNVLASAPGPIPAKTSRRLQLVHIWARTRFFQRIFMVALVGWICCIIYSTSFLQQIFHMDEIARFHDKLQDQSENSQLSSPIMESVGDLNTLTDFIRPRSESTKHVETDHFEEDETTARFRHRDLDPHRRLSPYYWPVMLSLYNLSLIDKYITVLPSIRLSQAVSPPEAVAMRNPEETLHWSTLAVALDPLDFSGPDGSSKSNSLLDSFDRPFIPRSPMEIALACILVLVSVLVLSYMTVVLYRCICSRNYAEWRSSWQAEKQQHHDNQVVLEAVAMSLEGHYHEVECLATDEYQVVSSDLSGHIRVWNAYDGEPVYHFDRSIQFEKQVSDPELNHSDYESSSPPSRGEGEGRDKRLSLPEGNPSKASSPIWCLDCRHGIIAVGCANGSLEFYMPGKSKVQCIFDDGNRIGVTAVKLVDQKVVVARLNGSIDFLLLENHRSTSSPRSNWGFSASRRTHVRAASVGSTLDWHTVEVEELVCIRLQSVRAHQQPITVLDCDSGRVVTGSQDHTLKVLRVEEPSLLYTLHGHCGPITCMFIDRVNPYLSGSGSQDGLLCVWDLLTGACMYSLQAHDGSITTLTYSASYVISLGTDEKLCVWERFLGHLLQTIPVTFCTSMTMLTHHLLVSAKQGSLVLWDVRTGEPVRIVRLGHTDQAVFVKQIVQVGDSVVCDYGNQLRIVKFPIVTDKTD